MDMVYLGLVVLFLFIIVNAIYGAEALRKPS